MKREARILLHKAIDSVVLAIEHFNRAWDKGRHETVLILFDRSFELLLKAAIVHKGGHIREPRAKETIGFDKCIQKCISDADLKCLTEEEALTIQIINSLRDAAQHYIIEISEHQLYVYTQAGLTLFNKILQDVFQQTLGDYFPERVLPVSTSPPKSLVSLINTEFEDIKALLEPGSRKRLQARAKLRSLAIIEASLEGRRSQPGENELGRLVRRIINGEDWPSIFPGVATLRLDRKGTGLNVTLRITKSRGEPVHLVPEGTPGATVVAVKRVSELDFYSLNLTALAEKVRLTMPKTLALVKHLGMQNDPEYFKEFIIDSTHHKRYSPKALDRIKKELPQIDLDEVWKKHKPKYGKQAAPLGGQTS
ncbi:MAG TPA: hypothetical protein EYP28_05660 [Methanophagales archaeon]|nr:hypothetical protein [Methanophagales archaeon]